MTIINQEAPVQCSKSIIINANEDKVWKVLTNIDLWASWQTDISKAKLQGQLVSGSAFRWKTGGANIESVLHTVEPNNTFGWTGKTFGMFAIHNWTLTEENGHTTVLVDESMEGFLARLFKKAFNSNLEKGMQKWLKLLKAECER